MPVRSKHTSQERLSVIEKHISQLKTYWSKWPTYLDEGDLEQAGEKGWGAVSQLVKAVAEFRGWQHNSYEKVRDIILTLARESERETDIRTGFTAADKLRGNFYEIFLRDREDAEHAFSLIIPMMEALWALLPSRYTGRRSFTDWAAQ